MLNKISLNFLLATLIFLLTAYFSHLLASPQGDYRPGYLIQISYTNANDQNKEESEFVELLKNELYDSGFKVETISSPEINTRNYLDENPSVVHLITNIFSDGDTFIKASLYTQTFTDSPRQFEADSARKLMNQISTYLISKDTVLLRALVTERLASYSSEFSRHINQGLILFEANEIHRAIKEFEMAASINPDSALPHLNLALCYKRIGDYEKRKAHIISGIDLDPQNNDLNNELALIYISEEKYSEAIEILETLPKDNPIYKWNLAYVYSQVGQLDQSRKLLKEIIELDANSSIELVAVERLHALERKEDILARTRQSLWVASIGLIVIAIIALIAIIIKRGSKGTSSLGSLPAKDLLALRIELSVALISGLFSVLTIVLPKLLGA